MIPQEPVPEQGIIGHEVEEVEQLDATQTAKKPFKIITFLRKHGAGKLTKEDLAEYNEFDKNYNWATGIRKVESSYSIGDGIAAIEGIAASSMPGTRQIIKAEATSERNGPSFASRTLQASDISSQDGSYGDFTGNRLMDTIEDFKKFGQLLSYDDPFDTHEYINGTATSRNEENTGIKSDEDDMMQNPVNDGLANGDQSQVPELKLSAAVRRKRRVQAKILELEEHSNSLKLENKLLRAQLREIGVILSKIPGLMAPEDE